MVEKNKVATFGIAPSALVSDASFTLDALKSAESGRIEETAETLRFILATQVTRIRVAQEEGLDVDIHRGTVEKLDELISIVEG